MQTIKEIYRNFNLTKKEKKELVKQKVKKWEFTDLEWNKYSLWRFVNYNTWIPLNQCSYEK